MKKSNTINTLPDWQADYDQWIKAGTAQSIRRAYDRDIKYFTQWVKTHLKIDVGRPNLSTPSIVIQFCLYHLADSSPKRLKVSTLRRYLASVSVAHKEAVLTPPPPMSK